MPQAPPNTDPGRTPRVVAAWIVGLLLAASALHVLFPFPKKEPASPPSAEESDAAAATPAISYRGNGLVLTLASNDRPANPLDADRAMSYLRTLCDLGPRPSGSEAMAAQQKLLVEHFEPLADEVTLQRFKAPNPLGGERVRMANVVAKWRLDAKRRLLLCAHYDTRPVPDQDPDPRLRKTGVFLGANDGASGTAVLMELAHLMQDRFGEGSGGGVGVDFVLFDGEELIYDARRDRNYFLGSQWFGMQYKKRDPSDWEYEAAVLLDMVGDADLQIFWERRSFASRRTRPIAREVWAVAERLGVEEFVPRAKHDVLDDHVALQKYGGIPAIDVIDFDYPHWHTTHDTPDKCSGTSLAKVGWVAWEWLLERDAAVGAAN